MLLNPGCSRSFALLSIVLLMALPLRAQNSEVPRTRTFSGLVAPAFPYVAPEKVGLSSEKLGWLGDEITGWVANGELVGAELLIIKDGKAVFHEAYGWSDREKRIPVERNSIWSIKSMSKPFTAAAVLMLVEEEKLSLADPVGRHIPGFAGDKRTTVHHLLCHASGFEGNYGRGGEEDDYTTLENWVKDWATEGATKPLSEFSYSDFNYAALGYIVEKVSGMPIATFTEKRIIEPLRLSDTSTGFSSDPAWRARLNPWYRWNERANAYDLRWASNRPGWAFYPATWGLFSTAMDYAEFMGMWLRKGEWNGVRLLSDAAAEKALAPHAREDVLYGYGYGWNIQQSPGADGAPLSFFHGGGDGTLGIAFPADNAIVIYLTHSRWGPHHDAFWNRLGMSGLFAFPGPDMVWAKEQNVAEVALSPAERSRYTGAYAAVEPVENVFESLRVWEEDGRLHLRAGPSGVKAADHRFHLVPLGDDRFALGRYADSRLQAVEPIFRLRFIVKEGVATVLDVIEGNRVLASAQRIE